MPAAVLAVPVGSAAPAAQSDSADKIKPKLAQQLEDNGEATFWVRFEATADLSSASKIEDWTKRGQAVYDALTATAAESQQDTLALLKGERAQFETFWATNAIRVKAGSLELAKRVAADPAVADLYPTQEYTLEKPTTGTDEHEVNAVEWGIANINADDVWDQYGVTGEGITVASIDTGVQYDHPALANKYRGNNGDGTFTHDYNWFDAASNCADAPCDTNGHGTHTMGTMTGDDGAGNQIGVAPGAKWIAANGCCPTDAALIASTQWMLAPTDRAGQNPRVALRPHIVNNSWGTRSPSNDPFIEDIQLAWAASGIFGMWSNGNIGPSCQTSGSPGSRIINYSAGAYDIDNTIADFSSRGSGQDGDIKPNIAAPGVNVRSSFPGSSFGSISGTSMASPHVAGTVALLWSAAPSLVGDIEATKALLEDSAVDVDATECGGDADDNNVFGEGRLDALAAVAASPREPTGTLIGTVTDAAGKPLPGATVSVGGGPRPPSTVTETDGTYQISHVIAGTHDVTAHAFGYTPVTKSAEIVVGQDTSINLALKALATHPVSGTVTDGAGNPIRATVAIEGTPLKPAVTDANGKYSFDAVPQGAYTVTAASGGCFGQKTADLAVDGPETLDAQLAERRDGFGHSCRLEPADYIETTDGLPINGDDVMKQVQLPFAFPHYGATYSQAYVSSNGFVAFKRPSLTEFCDAGCNMAIPTRIDPDAAIYVFWDDLMVDVDSGGQVSTADLGDRFVIEWRNVAYYSNDASRVDAELVLHDDGQIVMQYRSLDTSWDRGQMASVGMEDAYGTDAFQYSFDQAILTGDAIRFTRPSTGTVAGVITDRAGQPIPGVSVTRTDFQTATSAPDGRYTSKLPVGTWTLTFAKRGFVTQSRKVTVSNGGRITADVELRPLVTAGPAAITATVLAGEQRTVPVQLTNNSTAPLDWKARERGGAGADPTTTQRPSEGATDDEPKVLVYADRVYYPTPDAYLEQALRQLGLPSTAYTEWGDFDGFNAALQQGDWDLVIFAALALPESRTLDLLYEWVADGGKLIIECHCLGAGWLSTHPLWSALGVEFVAEDTMPPRAPVHWWQPAHPLLTTPEAVPEQTEYTPPTTGYVSTIGQYVKALPGATALAGYTERPASIQAAMVLANDDRTLFRGFTDWANVNDLDADGTYDMVELWTNSILAIMHGFSQDVPWLEVSPPNGQIAPGQSQTLEASLDTTGLAPGTHTASVVVDGTAGPGGTRLTIPVNLKVITTPEPIPTTLTGTATSFPYGESGKVAISVTPKAATGKVDVRKGSKVLATGTLSAGKVTVTLPGRSLLPGQHQLTLRYRGDASHAASSATVKLTVRKAKPALTVAVPKQVKQGERATVKVAVRAPFGVPVSGVVRVTFAGKTVSGWLRADDRVVLRLPKTTRTGWFKVKIAYLGSSVLEAATKTPYIRVVRRR